MPAASDDTGGETTDTADDVDEPDEGETTGELPDVIETDEGTTTGEDIAPDTGGLPEDTHVSGCTGNAQCSDGDPCTFDECSAGKCSNPANPLCASNSPCEIADGPGSNDSAVTDCVCGLDPYCCDTAWDGLCVDEADQQCNAPCACEDLGPGELTCHHAGARHRGVQPSVGQRRLLIGQQVMQHAVGQTTR